MTWRRLLHRTREDRDHAREFQSHLEMEIDDNLARGMPPAEARREAHCKFGSPTLFREEVYQMLSIEILLQDIRYGMRQLSRTPGFAAIAILTVALGIGANTAIFSVMNAALLRFLPVPQPRQLVFLNTTESFGSQSGDGDTSLTEYIFEQLRTERRIFSDLVAFAPVSFNKIAVRYRAEPEEAMVEMVSGDFFSGLGVRAAAGRTFSLEEETSHAPLAVASYAWAARHEAEPASLMGRTVRIRGIPFTIIGVAAAGFMGVENKKATDLWIPLQTRAELKPWGHPPNGELSLYGSAHTWWCLKTIGRLKPGIPWQQALAELTPVFEHAALDGIERNPHSEKPRLYFTPARGIDGMREDYQQALTVLMLMVAVVLAIGCANIATLLIARNSGRQREFSLRMAIGGSRVRLFRQLLTESMLLAAAGSVLGWVFARWATRALAVWTRLDLSLTPDRTVLFFTLALTLLAGLVFGLAPLSRVVRIPAALVLRGSGSAAAQDRGNLRGRPIVVALETAACLVLLVAAGLLFQSLRNLGALDLGIRTRGLLVFGISPQNLHSHDEILRFYQALIERLRALPGVESATLMGNRIGSGLSANSSFLVDGGDPNGNYDAHIRWNTAGPGYFHVLETPVLIGRDFLASDGPAAPPAAIVNETFARLYLAGRDPLGHQVNLGSSRGPRFTIVGVVRDIKYTGVLEKAMPMAWFPFMQLPGVSSMNVELRTAGDPSALLPAARRAMFEFAPDLPLLQPMTQKAQYEDSYSTERLLARLAIFFGLLAALLVATGLYGTLAYSVGRRTAEVGIRMALGAQRGEVLWMVLRGSLAMTGAGILIGLPLAIAGARFLRTLLFGVDPTDPRMLAGGVIGILVVAVAAALVPSRRAASVDPVVALRFE